MKKVIYEGKECEVPDWAKFVAADKNGCVYAYENRPEIDRIAGMWYEPINSDSRVAEVDIDRPDWKDSLVEIEE